jgi:hypothetical protein
MSYVANLLHKEKHTNVIYSILHTTNELLLLEISTFETLWYLCGAVEVIIITSPCNY